MTAKPKIAVLIDWFLPGTKAGGPVRSVYSLLCLMKDEYDFFLITTRFDLGSTQPYSSVTPNEFTVKEGVTYYYFDSSRPSSSEVRKVLNTIRPDLIYLNSFWSYPFSIAVVRAKHAGQITCPILLAPRGMLGRGALGLKSLKKRVFLSVAKFASWYTGVVFHATQEQEKADVLAKFSANKVQVAPNVNSGVALQNTSSKKKSHLKLFYLSRIAEVKNLHFALQVLKEVPPDLKVEYDIYGNTEDGDYWRHCLRLIGELPANIIVSYKGELQFNEVQKVLVGYNALFLPTLNENFGHSIVESLLCGCPVIISDQTPWNDVNKYDCGRAVALENKSGFLQAVINLGNLDQAGFTKMSLRAVEYISGSIDQQQIKKQYRILFNDNIKN